MSLTSAKVAKMLGITGAALSKYIKAGKVPKPKSVSSGGMTIYLWTEAEVQHVRQLLPKIANGRKTRYQKEQLVEAQTKSKTKKKPQPRAAVPHEQRQKKQ